jgi:hypothetical protein
MAYKKTDVGGKKVGYGPDKDEAKNAAFDVEAVDVGQSSTEWGGSNAGSKAKAMTRSELACDRNMNDVGPLGGPKYGVSKNPSTYNNK